MEKTVFIQILDKFIFRPEHYVAEKPYKVLLDQYVIKKYGMISTTLDRNQIRDRLVKGVDKKGKVVSNWDLNAFAPAGILSTRNIFHLPRLT